MRITSIDSKLQQKNQKVVVIGVGSGGSAIALMASDKDTSADFEFHYCDEPNGCKNDPDTGRSLALKKLPALDKIINDGVRMVVLLSTLGGGTGSGATPVIAKHLVANGIAVHCVVTTPFEFEGDVRYANADAAAVELLNAAVSTKVVNLANYAKVCNPDEDFRTFMDKIDKILIKEIASLV